MGSAAHQRQRYPGEREQHNTDEPTALEVRMRQILSDADFPAISKPALDALKATPEDDASIQRLANIVLQDYSLTLKVMRTANSAYYKRGGAPVQSATHAMLLLGARTVRHLAASLLVFDHYRKRSPGLKELMLMSMITANHARELAMLRRLPDPEEAHLAGMFRNLGEVLAAGYFPREYARIIHDMEANHKPVAQAAFEVLGFVFEDLGEALAKHWGMPESVVTSVRADGPVGATDLAAIVACAHDLTTAVYRHEHADRLDGAQEVMARYAKRLKLTKDEATGVVRSALRETKETFGAAKVTLDDLRLRKQHDAAIAELGGWVPVPTPPGATAVAPAAPDPILLLRSDLAAEVKRAAEPDSGEDLNRVILTLLEGIFRGGPFDRAVFCALSPDRGSVRARFGLGTAVEELLESFSFELTPREGPVAVAMLRRQSMYVPVDRDFTAQELRFAQQMGAGSFGVFPVLVGIQVVGCVYCDRPWNARPPDRATVAFVRSLCDGAARGIAHRRTVPSMAAVVKGRPTPTVMRATPTYALAVRQDAVFRVLKGEEVARVAEELAIPAEMLEQWRKAFLESELARERPA